MSERSRYTLCDSLQRDQDALTEQIRKQVEAFKAKGGVIQQIPSGVGVDAILNRQEVKEREGRVQLGEKPKRAAQGAAFKIKTEYEKNKGKKEEI